MASRLGYRPKKAGRLSWNTSTDITPIGVLICNKAPTGEQPVIHTQKMLAGMSEIAKKINLSLLVDYVKYEDVFSLLNKNNLPPTLRSAGVSGLILIQQFPPEVVKALNEMFPCVTIVHHKAEQDTDVVDSDALDAMEQIVGHLHELGHRKIGFITSSHEYSWSHARFAGYCAMMSRLRLPLNPDWMLNIYNQKDLSESQIADIIQSKRKEDVTAWVTAGDMLLMKICDQLRQRNISVPGDVSLTGYDAITEISRPEKPTTISVPFEELGAVAARQLVYRIQQPTAPKQHIMIHCRMTTGNTTGPAT